MMKTPSSVRERMTHDRMSREQSRRRYLHVAYKAIQRANIMQQEARQESDGRLRALRMETAG